MDTAKLPIFIVAAFLLISLTPNADAKEVRAFRFSFQIPDTWYVDGGNGEMNLYASASSEPYQPPLIMVETCVTTKEKDCVKEAIDPFPYDLARQKDAYDDNYKSLGCTGATIIALPRENGVMERRLVCTSVGYSLFITKSAVLWMAYTPDDKSTGIVEFLDTVAYSLWIR